MSWHSKGRRSARNELGWAGIICDSPREDKRSLNLEKGACEFFYLIILDAPFFL
jgi:hypothetical protein